MHADPGLFRRLYVFFALRGILLRQDDTSREIIITIGYRRDLGHDDSFELQSLRRALAGAARHGGEVHAPRWPLRCGCGPRARTAMYARTSRADGCLLRRPAQKSVGADACARVPLPRFDARAGTPPTAHTPDRARTRSRAEHAAASPRLPLLASPRLPFPPLPLPWRLTSRRDTPHTYFFLAKIPPLIPPGVPHTDCLILTCTYRRDLLRLTCPVRVWAGRASGAGPAGGGRGRGAPGGGGAWRVGDTELCCFGVGRRRTRPRCSWWRRRWPSPWRTGPPPIILFQNEYL